MAQPAAAEPAPPYDAPAGHGGGRGPALAVVAVVTVVALGAIAVGAYLLLGGDSDGEGSPVDWNIGSSGYENVDLSSDAAARDDELPDESERAPAETDADATAGGDPIEPQLETGDYLQLGSFRGDGAPVEAARLEQHGIDAFVVDSDGIAELLPGFKVVVAGPLAGRGERNRVMRAGRRSGIAPLDRSLSPLTIAPEPATVAGSFDAELVRTPSKRPVEATFSFAADGLSGTVDYSRPRCSSELSFARTDLGTLEYDETVTAGSCADGGSWALKPDGDRLSAAWYEPDSDHFLSGDLVGGDAGYGE